LRASIDYYDIDLKNAISTLSAQLIVDRCRAQGNYCDLVTFGANGSVDQVRTLFLNLNRLQTSGFDIELGYRLSLASLLAQVPGAVYFNLGARYRVMQIKDNTLELFFGVQNVLNRDPPVAPSNQGSTNMLLFDPLGRSYRAGVRLSL